ncbi:MAG: hypothetical protein IPM29_13040 [Planctomycetes bacterium]|nr:hypothetical protein [Planctomycetota bacterium]
MRALLTLLGLLAIALPATAQKVSYDEFARAVDEQVRLNDTKRLVRTVRDNPVHTVGHFQGLVLSDLNSRRDDNLTQRNALKAAWEEAFRGRTLDQLDRWLQLVASDSSRLRSYDSAKQALSRAYQEFNRMKSEAVTDRGPWDALRRSTEEIARAFESVGHKIDAAEACGLLARICTDVPGRTLDDRKAAIVALQRFLDHRKDWDYTEDVYYQQNLSYMKAEEERMKAEDAEAAKREAEGYRGDIKGADAFLLPNANDLEVVAPLTFEALKKGKEFDYCIRGNSAPLEWWGVRALANTPTALAWFKGADIHLLWSGSTGFGITRDPAITSLDAPGVDEVQASNRIKDPSVFHLDNDATRHYAMWFFVGGDQEPFQGINQNLAPSENGVTVFYRSAASWVADVNGTKVTFFDDNANGLLFEEDPFGVGLTDHNVGTGPDDEVKVPTFDGMQIGRGPRQPLGAWVKLGDSWYHMRSHENGASVGFRPCNPEYFKTGTIQMHWKGPRNLEPMFLLVRGEGDFEMAVFDLADGKAHEVPAGNYRIQFGRIESGKGPRLMSANIFPGSAEVIEVKPGEAAEFSLGGPFRLDFAKQTEGAQVALQPLTIRIRGLSGEIYSHVNGAAPEAEVVVARSDNGRGARVVGELQAIDSAELLFGIANKFTKLGGQVGYYPVPHGTKPGDDIVLRIDVPEGQFIGLQEKKNKLFGKLDAIWK